MYNPNVWRDGLYGPTIPPSSIPDTQPRRVVQITASPAGQNFICAYALCSDNTVWVYLHSSIYEQSISWVRLPDIPQEKIK